jgi:dynein heavy chain 2
LLKLCTGECFEKQHWAKLFSILKISKQVRDVEELTFKSLVLSLDNMIEKAKDIRELADTAQGEVTIREAINELKIWCESTEFVLTEH